MAFHSAEIVVRETEASACHAEAILSLADSVTLGGLTVGDWFPYPILSRLHRNQYAMEHTEDLVLPLMINP
jgi:hypothetical protein